MTELAKLSISALVAKYNEVAETLGKKTVKTFKDKPTAIDRVKKILKEVPKEGGEAKEKKVKALPKTAKARTIKRLSLQMFRTVKIVKEHPGTHMRFNRWKNYKDGMTLYEVIVGENTSLRDINFFVKYGFIKLEKADVKAYEKKVKELNA